MRSSALLVASLLALGAFLCEGAAAAGCSATSGATAPVVVELYTSEGCSSCPPAERWLAALKGRPDVVSLAFHVDYWDTRDWKDRFSQAKFTRRQNAMLRTSGARFAYTPQVLVDGQDVPQWSRVQASALQATRRAPVALALARDEAGLGLTVTPGPGAPTNLAGYLAVVDDGMESHVEGGENRGITLHQDSVVRELSPWSVNGAQPTPLRFASRSVPEPGAVRHWVAVAVDGTDGRPLQAVVLNCAP
jgi:hypothetical protein